MSQIRRFLCKKVLNNNWTWFFLTLIFCCSTLIVHSGKKNISLTNILPIKSFFPVQTTAVEIYAHARQLKVDQTPTSTCPWAIGRRIEYCAGFCPFIPTRLVKCEFLPRIVNKAFADLGMYCIPPADSCPGYDANSKDKLPRTLEVVKTIPTNLLANFTLDGLITVSYKSGFDFINTNGKIAWSKEEIENYRKQVKKREAFGTFKTSDLYPVLELYAKTAVTGKNVGVISYIYPWVEAALLEYGALSITTIDNTPIESPFSQIHTFTHSEYTEKQAKLFREGKFEQFDSVWSYSSLEHDGLGRFTDPINPDGDLQMLTKISCMLKPGGLLFLAIPTNQKDAIFFNLHRVYGPIRYPLVLQYFHLVQAFITDVTNHVEQHNQPILVLQNKVGCE